MTLPLDSIKLANAERRRVKAGLPPPPWETGTTGFTHVRGVWPSELFRSIEIECSGDSPEQAEAVAAIVLGAFNDPVEDTVDALVGRVQELEGEREWISVEERLPEAVGEYLCVAPVVGQRVCRVLLTFIDGQFLEFHDDLQTHFPVNATYWMPVPAPPRAGEGGEEA